MRAIRNLYSRSFRKAAKLLAVLIVIALLVGLLFKSLPLAQFSDAEPSRVVVTAVLSAGSANDLPASEREILKDALENLPGISYMGFGTTSAHEAVMMIVFDQGTDGKAAVSNVQKRINAVQNTLPSLTKRGEAVVTETVTSRLVFLNIHITARRFDQLLLENESLVQLLAELKQLRGVADTTILSSHRSVFRLKADRDAMKHWNIPAQEIENAMMDSSMIGFPIQEVGNTPQWIEFALLTWNSRYDTREKRENIILKASSDGDIVRFKDIGHGELSPLFYDHWDGPADQYSATIVLTKLPDASPNTVMKEVEQLLDKFKTTSLSPDMSFDDKLSGSWQLQPIRAKPANP